MINELPTVFDIVTGKKLVKDKPAVNNNSGNKAKSTTKVVSTEKVNAKAYHNECMDLLFLSGLGRVHHANVAVNLMFSLGL